MVLAFSGAEAVDGAGEAFDFALLADESRDEGVVIMAGW